MPKNFLCLGIETSCDETAASVVQNGRTILSSVVRSQENIHKLYGGVVPELAAREHLPIAGLGALQVYPNPFNPRTTVGFSLARASQIRLSVHDVTGHRLAVLAAGRYPAGRHTLVWDGGDENGRDLPSGTYLMRCEGDGMVSSQKVTLLR